MPDHQQADTSAPSALILRTLGGAALEEVSGDGTRVLLLGPGKSLGALVYLACAAGRTTTRDHLTDLLWSELDPDAARHSLRHALWSLRRHLGDGAIAATDGTLHLVAQLESDRDAFLAAAERQDFERAVELYGGDFLPVFAAPGAADFEQWADAERARLRYLYLRAVEAVVRDWLSKGRLRRARQLATRVRDAERRDEAASRLVLECLLAAGDVVAAELEVRQLEEILNEEKRPPEAATSRMFVRVRAQAGQRLDSAGDDTGPGLVAELVGREREFSVVLAAWDRARHGKGGHVRISGAAGLGKTRLLADIHARLRSMGAAAISVRANAGEQRIPYALASEMALALAALPGSAALSSGSAAALVALNPSLSARYAIASDRSPDADVLRRRVSALEELVAAIADEQPVAILADDLHWADAESRQVVQALLPKLGRRRVLLVTADRPGSGGVSAEETEALTLEPLTRQQTAALVASLGVLPAATWVGGFLVGLHAAARGSPLLTLETLRLALERELLAFKDGEWACADPGGLTVELARGGALRRRIEQLDRHQGWLLRLLALAGAPMPARQLASAADAEEGATARELTSLEVRGLVSRDGSEWQPGHDEIAAMVLEVASQDALGAAHRALGATFVAAAGEDANLLKRAGKHLATGGDEGKLGQAFERWARVARRRGDRHSLTALAADYLAGAASGGAPRRLVAMLPLAARARLTTGRTLAVAAGATALALSAAAWLLLRPGAPEPDAEFLAITRVNDGTAVVYRVPVRREWLEQRRAIDVVRDGAVVPALTEAATTALTGGTLAAAPDGNHWAFQAVVPDSGGNELFVVNSAGEQRRLTWSPKDDGSPSWAPDGRSLAFQSARWTASGRSKLSLLDLATGAVTQLTSGDNSDGGPMWSPDGTRIAFPRAPLLATSARAADRTGPELCWIAVRGDRERCIDPQRTTLGVVGWYDAHQVLAESRDSLGATSLVRADLDSHETHLVSRDLTGSFTASGDGRWIACRCERRGVTASAWYVFPTERPDLAVPVTIPGAAGSALVLWQPRRAARVYLDRLEIVPATARIALGSVERLAVRGYDPDGRAVPVPVLTWRTGDTAIVSVDSARGDVVPRRSGTAVIRASAGGWREDSVRLSVTEPAWSTVFTEDWSRGLAEWVPYGEPLPVVVDGPGGRPFFLNNGDRSFYSGAYTRRAYRGDSGVGVEAVISSPVRAYQDQIIAVTLLPWTDSVLIARWDHRGGGFPGTSGCNIQYPPSDGPVGMRVIGLNGHWIGVGSAVASEPYTIRIQLLPDGRCGLAINGKPMYVTSDAWPTSAPYRVRLEGKSVGARMLVGHLEMWVGVKPGVDWALAQRSP